MTRLILAVRLGQAGCRGSDTEDVVQETCARWYALCWQQQDAIESLRRLAGRRSPAASAWTASSTARDIPGFCDSSGLEVGHCCAAHHIERHRSLVVRDQPAAVDLPEAESGADPRAARRRPVLQHAAEPAKAVPVCHLIAHGECQIANLISHILEEREHLRPVLQLRLYPDMLQWRLDVEGHDVRCVKLLQSLKILGPDSFDNLLDLPANRGFVYLALRRHRFSSRLSGVESWLPLVRRHSTPGCKGRERPGLAWSSRVWPVSRSPPAKPYVHAVLPHTAYRRSSPSASSLPEPVPEDLGAMTMATASAQALSPDTRQRTRNATRSV